MTEMEVERSAKVDFPFLPYFMIVNVMSYFEAEKFLRVGACHNLEGFGHWIPRGVVKWKDTGFRVICFLAGSSFIKGEEIDCSILILLRGTKKCGVVAK